jgi:hypothetical protein
MADKRLVRYLRYAIHGETEHARAPRRRARRSPARSWKYRAWICSLPSAVSEKMGCDAAHTGSDGGMSMKSSDYSCIPLTREEHDELDRGMGGRAGFERKYAIDIAALVKRLNHDWFALRHSVK